MDKVNTPKFTKISLLLHNNYALSNGWQEQMMMLLGLFEGSVTVL